MEVNDSCTSVVPFSLYAYSLCWTLTLTNFVIRPAHNGHELPIELLRLTDMAIESDYLKAKIYIGLLVANI